ncbi:ribonuclease P protein subunit p21 isoform X3 [Accipiter gentilis]|uniref:ribonuclease P protein subunit p21 isoform X3 n=1 Tax=Astur gentilis TaxID=8957 RepID=UPI00210FA5C0|nr:ribonuclease P protein subunit p21 isoform X3 [Accipiter gentilis]
MRNVGPAQPVGARPIGNAMAAPVRDREALQRLNFLFQVGRRAPSVKRAVCRRCCSLLLPGAGGYLRLRGRGQPRRVLRCRCCGRCRRYLCQQELRPPGQATPTGPAPEHSPA